jgi:hypothetical protein
MESSSGEIFLIKEIGASLLLSSATHIRSTQSCCVISEMKNVQKRERESERKKETTRIEGEIFPCGSFTAVLLSLSLSSRSLPYRPREREREKSHQNHDNE